MILIVGGAGYIGAHTNKLLAENGHQTVVYDSLVTGHRDSVHWGHFIHADLADTPKLEQCFRDHPIEAVMHFSSFSLVPESVEKPDLYYRNNVVNTLNLLDVMRKFDVPYFIFSSTCAIYGNPKTIPIDEHHPQNPISPYGRTKRMIEEILRDYDTAYGIKHVNLRYFNAAGADPEGLIGERHDPETHLIPLVIQTALGKRPTLKIFGTDYPTPDGTCVRDYIHVNDLADAHVKALEHLKTTNTSDAFNLGNGNGYSVKEIIDKVKKITNRDVQVENAPSRPGDPPVLVGASKKAQEHLNWKPRFNTIDTIIETAWNFHNRDTHSPENPK